MKITQYKIAIETTFSEEEIQISLGDYDLIGYEITESPNGWIDLFLKSESLIDLTNYLKAHHYEDLIDEITKEEIDWEEQFGFLKEGINYLMEESKKDRKKIRELEKELLETQTQIIETESFKIGLNFFTNNHWWEYSDNTEGGELIIRDRELIDYDGTYQLSNEIYKALEQQNIYVKDMM